MEHAHAAGGTGWVLLQVAVVVGLALVAAAYATGLRRSRHRSPWPARRTALFAGGLACVATALVGPLAEAARGSLTSHMVGHLLLGMLGPLLLVLGAPVTLALRALPVRRAQALSRVLRRLPARVVTHPVTAALLAGGGLWVLYGTDLYAAVHGSPWVHAAVHAHVLLAGYLFTASVVGVDPAPHRASVTVRSAVLVVLVAAHEVLAKRLYVHPPLGVEARDAEVGARLMAYGGDVVDVALVVLVAAGWYRSTRPRVPSPTPTATATAPAPAPAPAPTGPDARVP